jgi:hypothetical protein
LAALPSGGLLANLMRKLVRRKGGHGFKTMRIRGGLGGAVIFKWTM